MFFASWKVLCQLAPWLLLGMLLSGLLHVFLPAGFVRKKFQGAFGVVKAVLLGVPLPLCSCGVVPAGIGLKNQGASNGASVGFLISTPQTGVDSILVSASFFGWPFAFFKMAVAAITGVIGGWITDRVEIPAHENDDRDIASSATTHSHSNDTDAPAWKRCWSHGSEIAGSIWAWLVFGILVSAAIEVLVPQAWFEIVGDWGLLPSMFIVLLVSTPLYVCATASVPIAAALVTSGFPPAAALVFLMAGPATNVTTIGAIFGRFGWKTLIVYLLTIIVGSMTFAWLFDQILTAKISSHSGHDHEHNNWWSIASGIVLTIMILNFALQDAMRVFKKYSHRAAADEDLTQIQIEGMTCNGCVGKLETELQKNAGVDSVSIELKSGLATMVGSPDLEEIHSVVRKLGFEVVEESMKTETK